MLRTVIEEHSYVVELYKLMEEYPRMESINEGIKWELCRRPGEAGEPVNPGSCYFVFNTLELTPIPSFTVLYLYDNKCDPDHVKLLSIRARVDT